MNNEVINAEIKEIRKLVKESNLKKELSEEAAFEYLIMQYFCYKAKDIKSKLYDIDSAITNGTDDGGIDFVYYDDEEAKVILGQCKYTEKMQLNDVIVEYIKEELYSKNILDV